MKKALKKYFGYETFRPMQEEIITDVLAKKDVFVLMPTGGGKSLCYQIPAVLQEGLTIVISPLISLMKDQVDGLKQVGIEAAFLNSTQNYQEQNLIIDAIRKATLKILYVAPERFNTGAFQSLIETVNISLLAIDEAHCISEWGHDFRPDYRELSKIRSENSNLANIPIIALTATATGRVKADIINHLALMDPARYQLSFDRKNLYYEVRNKADSFDQINLYLQKHRNQSGIIYCHSRDNVEQLSEYLRQNGYNCLPYHAGLDESARKVNQEKFIRDDVDIIVATIAFGMGIDKPDVRFVIHRDLPSNLERFYQETGRAGRDGLDSECILFYSYADKSKIEYFIDQKDDTLNSEGTSEWEIAKHQLKDMVKFAESVSCRRKILLNYFGEDYGEKNCGKCDICLNPPETFDATELCMKIISCVYRLDQRFGIAHVTKVLAGSRSKKVLNSRHDTLSTYGIVNDFSTKEISAYIRQLVQLGYLKLTDEKYPVLRITGQGAGFLKQKNTVYLHKLKDIVHEEKKEDYYDPGLFEVLRSLRKSLADKQNIPPYMIFSDITLKEISSRFPSNSMELSEIKGIGEQKIKKYSEPFLDAVLRYLEQNKVKPGLFRLSDTIKLTLQMYKSGLGIDEIARERDLKKTTIFGHIEKIYLAGEDINLNKYVPEKKFRKIEKVFKKIGENRLKPAKEKLGSNYDYWEIAFVRAKLAREDGIHFR